jgi:hypothetical protein
MWIILFAVPASARLYQTNHSITGCEYAWLFKYLAHKDPSTTLTIAGSDIGPILYNMPAITTGAAKLSRWQIKTCLREGIYREIIVLQRFQLDLKSGKYVESGPVPLGEGFKLETIDEQKFYWDRITRLSRVVDVDVSKIPAPDGLKEEKKQFSDDSEAIAYLLSQYP